MVKLRLVPVGVGPSGQRPVPTGGYRVVRFFRKLAPGISPVVSVTPCFYDWPGFGNAAQLAKRNTSSSWDLGFADGAQLH